MNESLHEVVKKKSSATILLLKFEFKHLNISLAVVSIGKISQLL